MSILAEIHQLCDVFERREIEFDSFLDQYTRIVAATIGCSRAGVWVFQGKQPHLRMHCLAMYDADRDRAVTVPDEEGSPVEDYFLALEQTGHVIAADAQKHFATAGFFDKWLRTNNVKSLLAASFSVNGRLYGAFTCTQVGCQMEWSGQQLSALRAMGLRVSLMLANADRAPTDTWPALLE